MAPTGDGGFVLTEPGPASTIEALERGVQAAGFAIDELRAVLVTHVHLDHSGAAGTLARRVRCPVLVHPEGAAHLIDPERLLASAERLYGPMMIPLWGETLSAPRELVRVMADGETAVFGELEASAWHTPGHARHHVIWQLGEQVATGDLAGVRFPGASHVLPPMPPPDIDVGLWLDSLERLRQLKPSRLLLTHFGAFDDVDRHLDELEARIERWSTLAGAAVGEGLAAEDLVDRLTKLDEDEMAASEVPPAAVERYRRLCPMDGNSAGLLRYWQKRLG